MNKLRRQRLYFIEVKTAGIFKAEYERGETMQRNHTRNLLRVPWDYSVAY